MGNGYRVSRFETVLETTLAGLLSMRKIEFEDR